MYIDSDKKISTSCLDIYRSNSLSWSRNAWQRPMRGLPLLSGTDWQDALYSDNVHYPYVRKGDIVIKFEPTRWGTGITQNPRGRKQMCLLFHTRSLCSHTTFITRRRQWSRRSAYRWDRKKRQACSVTQKGFEYEDPRDQLMPVRKRNTFSFHPHHFITPWMDLRVGVEVCPCRIGHHFEFAAHHL